MIRRLWTLSRRPFIRNVATVATGTVLAQAIVVAFSPIITRLYGPEAFGVLGVFASLTAMVVPVASLTYHVAIVLPAEDEDAKGLVALSLMIAAGISSLLALVVLFFRSAVVELLQIQVVASLIFLVPVVVFLASCTQILRQWMIRKQQYKRTAAIMVTSTLSLNSTKACAGLLWPSPVILVLLATFGNLLDSTMFAIASLRTLLAAPFKETGRHIPSRGHIAAMEKRYRDFPTLRAPGTLLTAGSVGLPVLLLTSLFGPAPAGFYALGARVLALPAQIIGTAIGDVFYPRIAQAGNSGENVQRLIVRATLGLAALGLVPYGVVVAFGPWLFGFVFGSEWVAAGEFGRWLAMWMFFMFINKPSTVAIPVLDIQGFGLVFNIVMIVARVAALFGGYAMWGSALVAISLYCIAGVVLNAVLILIVIVKSGKGVVRRQVAPVDAEACSQDLSEPKVDS